MAHSNLIIITNGYPFNNGENFIDSELKYTAKVFDKVHILAINNFHKNQRPVPENVIIHKVKASLSIYEKTILSIKLITQIKTIIKLYRNEIEDVNYFIKPVNLINIKKQIIHDIFISFRKFYILEKLVNNNLIDLYNSLFYSYWINSSATALSLFKIKHPEIKAICRAHGSDIYFESSKINYHSFRLFTINHLDYIFSVSKKGVDYHTEKYNKFFPNIKTAYLGTNRPFEISTIKETDSFILVSVASVIPLKRVELIPLMLSQIYNINIKWIHFGSGSGFSKLESRSNQYLYTKSNIQYELKGFVANEKILEFYSNNKIDLFISLSSSEGIPVSMMEAMSYSIPCLSTNIGGVQELINDNINGFLVNPELDFQEIKEVIVKYNSMSIEDKNTIKNNAYNCWKKQFNAETNFSKFATNLKQII